MPGPIGAAVLTAAVARFVVPAVLSVGGFHRPASERRRQGALSAAGYYADAYDYPALVERVLSPLGPGGDRRYVTAVFDHVLDRPVPVEPRVAGRHAVVLVDGVFLFRAGLRPSWDLAIHLDVPPEETLRRARLRGAALFGSVAEVERRYRARYLPAPDIYRAQARARETAEVLIGMTDPSTPALRARAADRPAGCCSPSRSGSRDAR
jgi:uridine kinase